MTAVLTRPEPTQLRPVADTRPGAVYGRISKRKSGDGAGAHVKIDDQHAQSADMLRRACGPLAVEPFRDNMSAWDPDVWREDWERLLVEIAAGKFRAVGALNGDRYTRQPIQLEQLWAACKRGNAELYVVTQGLIIDPTMLRIEGALSARESDIKSKRARDHHARLATAGKPHGGRRRFGYLPDMGPIPDELDQLPAAELAAVELATREADAVRTVASKLLNGETLAACARYLNDHGLPGVTGSAWTGPNLRQMILRPHLAGLRVHKGQVVGTGTWDAVIDVATHEALKHKLGAPDRRTNYDNARKHLLSGLAVCGVCGGRIRTTGGTKHDRAYMCDTGHCVHRNVVHVDQRVTDVITARLRKMDARGLLVDDSVAVELADLTAKRAGLAARREALSDRWAAGEIDDATKDRDEASLNRTDAGWAARVTELTESAAAPQRALQGLTGPDPVESFTQLDLGRQRVVIDLLCTVHIDKAARRGAAFDPASVRIEPR